MYFVLSPAKNLNEAADAPLTRHSQPRLLSQAEALMPVLRQLAPQDMAKLMGVSDKIALLNTERNDNWQPPFTLDNAKQAVYLFNGDVYAGLDAHTLPETAVDYMQTHVALLSGLYGLLRPLDLIQPYRLEMGTRLANPRGKDLYAFWGERITELLAKMMAEQGSKVLINLASQEYFKSVHTAKLPARVITPVFKDEKNGQYKIISFYAKRARGLMVRYAAKHGLQEAQQLQAFDAEGYAFNAAASSENEWVFLRPEQSK
jgi:cytoplasmic iron level regulating protein YaaA (DUF328/UPF0246 family)